MPQIVHLSDVFISYSRKNTVAARKLYDALRAEGLEVWADWEDIPKGAEWRKEIEAGVVGANAFLFLISPDSVDSVECRHEVELAVNHKKRMIPVLNVDLPKDYMEKTPSAISAHNWIFARETDPWDTAFQEILKTLKTDLDYVRVHTRLNVRAQEWQQGSKDKSYLLAGHDIADAEAWLAVGASKQPDPTELQIQYIQASRLAATQRQRQILIWVSVALVISVVLAIAAVFLGFQANSNANLAATNESKANNNAITAVANYNLAATNEIRAQDNEATAVQERDRANSNADLAATNEQRAVSLALAAQSNAALENSPVSALGLAMQAAQIEPGVPFVQHALADAAYSSKAIRGINLSDELFATDAAVLPDGTILTANDANMMALWDVNQPDPLQVWDAPTETFNAMDVTLDGRYAALAAENGDLTVIEVATGDIIASWLGSEDGLWSIAISPDGQRVIAIDYLGVAILWEVASQQQLARLAESDLNVAAFSPDGRWALGGYLTDWTVVLWDLTTYERVYTWAEHVNWVSALAFSRDGLWGASGAADGNIIIYNLATGEVDKRLYLHTAAISSLEFSADSDWLLSSSRDKLLAEWYLPEEGAVLTYNGHDDWLITAGYTADGLQAISIGWDDRILLWDLVPGVGSLLRKLPNPADVQDLVFSPDGQSVYVAYINNPIVQMDMSSEEVMRTFDYTGVYQLDLTETGSRLATGQVDGSVWVWDTATGETIFETQVSSTVISIDVSDDGNYIAVAAGDAETYVWEVDTGTQVFYMEQNWLTTIALQPGKPSIFITNLFGRITEYNYLTGEEVRLFSAGGTAHNDSIFALTFSKDGRWLLSGGGDAFVVLWDVASASPLKTFRGHLKAVSSVGFGPDNQVVISGGWDGNLIVWDINTGEPIRTYTLSPLQLTAVAFSPDGRSILTGANCYAIDNCSDSLVLWRYDPIDDLIAWTRENRYVRNLTCEERATYNVAPLCDE